MDWNEVSEKTRQLLDEFGSLGPTVNAGNKELKGYMIDKGGDAGKVYLSASDLRELAAACIEAADWLERRATLSTQQEG